MRTSEKKRHAKFTAVIALAKKHPEKMQKAPAFARLMQKIEADLAPVSTLTEQKEQSTKGLTLEKNQTYDTLKANTTRLCNLAIGHASVTENLALESDWTGWLAKLRSPQATFGVACTKVVTEIRKLSEHWADLGITEADVLDIEAKIALFDAQLPQSADVKMEKKKAGKKITAIIGTTTTTQKQLLKLAATFIGVDNELHADISEIMNPKKRTATTEIVVVFKSAETQKFLANQNAHVVGRKATPKSNKKGEIRFKFTEGGMKTIEVPLPNGEIRTFKDVEVPKGKTVTLIVEL